MKKEESQHLMVLGYRIFVTKIQVISLQNDELFFRFSLKR